MPINRSTVPPTLVGTSLHHLQWLKSTPMGRLLILFIVVPVLELLLLIEIGQRVGTLATVALVMGTGILGASLARQQGISTLARVRKDLDEGRVPAEPIVDGVLILLAAAVLITPGVLVPRGSVSGSAKRERRATSRHF